MPIAAIGVNSRALWYLTRGTGLVALVLLTVTLVLGITQVVRFARPGLPRFVISGLHKNASLVAVVLLVVHIATAVGDTFAPISIVDVFVPFVGTYRPLWLGLGALALDLMLALVVSSLIRDRIGLRAWRAIHWAAYASWPIAVAHGLGTGTDTKLSWVLVIYVICLAAVAGSLAWRLGTDWNPANAVRRGTGFAVAAVTVVALVVWTAAGPLGPHWARTAGTPTALLGGTATAALRLPVPSTPGSSSAGSSTSAGSLFSSPFATTFSGSLRQGTPNGNGTVSVTITATLTRPVGGKLAIVLEGTPDGGGGVSLSRGQVTLGASGTPQAYTGAVTQLAGQEIVAAVSGAGQSVTVDIRIDHLAASGSVTGTVQSAT